MKTIIRLILLTFLFQSCDKQSLEVTPTDRVGDDAIWTSAVTADLVLNDIYGSLNAGPLIATWLFLPSQVSNDPLDNFTDNAISGPIAGIPSRQLFENASYGPSNELFTNTWSTMYANIRKCNLFISKINEATFDEPTRKTMLAQAHFMRAYFYKTLTDLYGGVPLITDVLDNGTQGDAIFRPRNTYEECVAFIRRECDAAAADLPESWSGSQLGKVTKGAAKALKGEMELYAGMWDNAAATNQEIISSGKYSLFPDFEGLFYPQNENNREVIFDIQYAPNLRPVHTNQYWGAVWAKKGSGWAAMSPTQNLVDEFEFLDGKTEAEGSALFDAQHPYQHRCKRFYASILYDGCRWQGQPFNTRIGIPNNTNEFTPAATGNGNPSGYGLKKLLDSTIVAGNTNLDGRNVIVYRYAEVLLNYAEAQNEGKGPDQSVYDAVNQLRERAGLPPLPAGLSKDDMRKRIRRERRVELAFEGKYFYDIKRWKTAEEIFKKEIRGMKITGNPGSLHYEKVKLRSIVFDPKKHYLAPIPQDAMDKNDKLVQNQGY
jgi:hypothetical protein